MNISNPSLSQDILVDSIPVICEIIYVRSFIWINVVKN